MSVRKSNTINCAVCGSANVSALEEITLQTFFSRLLKMDEYSDSVIEKAEKTKKEIGTDEYVIYNCDKCGVKFSDPMKQPWGDWYSAVYTNFNKKAYRHRWEYDFVKEMVGDAETVLDVGCGEGQFLDTLSGEGISAFGVDFNEHAIQVARKKGLDAENRRVQELDQKYDWVCLFHILEHIADLRAFFDDIVSICKPGGKVVVSVPSQFSYADFIWDTSILNYPPHHLTMWTEDALKRFVCSFGLTVEKVLYEPISPAKFSHCYAEKVINKSVFGKFGVSSRIARGLFKTLFERNIVRLSREYTGKSLLGVFEKGK